MLRKINLLDLRKPWVLFCIGWVAIMVSLTVGIQPVWNTFMFVWKVEYTASLVLLALLAYGLYTFRDRAMKFSLPVLERNLIVFPILAIILWSSLSATWAPSWKSAIHHAAADRRRKKFLEASFNTCFDPHLPRRFRSRLVSYGLNVRRRAGDRDDLCQVRRAGQYNIASGHHRRR
jgi:hypothetical protein